MNKETFYFSHDYNARNDDKIKSMMFKHGMAGYGIYWSLIEELYNNANVLKTDYDRIAYELRVDKSSIIDIINEYDLFVTTDGFFHSSSVQNRLDQRNKKSVTARISANKRWNKEDKDADALQEECKPNAVYESKVKESKVNKIEERKLKFADTLKVYLETYGKEMLNEFYSYWTEPNKSNTKMRFELEQTWSLVRRMETWSKNDKKFSSTLGAKEIKTINYKEFK